MVEIIRAREWDHIIPSIKNVGHHDLFYVRVKEEHHIIEIAEDLNLPFIFKRVNELICSDGKFLYWYKP